MKLVVVESPTKAKTLNRFLPKEYQVAASMGHIRDLPRKKLGVDVEHNFEPSYVVVPAKRKALKKLKDLTDKSSQVILATDPDREGEAIAYHVQHLLNNKKTKFSRIVFHEITKEAVERALKNPGKINSELVDAQQARRVLDRLVGYKLSPLLWRKVRRGLSAGRVQSVAVKLIVEKEEQIRAFEPEEYWNISVELKKDQDQLEVDLKKKNNKNLDVSSETQAKKVVFDLEKSQYEVKSVAEKDLKVSPRPPFITSTLQRTASRVFRWSSKKTMREAQLLYEQGLITYHRTDSFNLAKSSLKKARGYIKSEFGDKFLPEKPRFYKRKSKMVQGAHEAIRPTNPKLKNPEASKDMTRLYKLIFKRFISCQMSNGLDKKTKVEVEAKTNGTNYLLDARGRRVVFLGWRQIYRKRRADDILPQVKKGDQLEYLKVNSEQKFTQPPTRYSEATLIKELEKQGIGRPSTYASIISTIQSRRYVEKKQGRFHPTPVGEAVNKFLTKHFDEVMDYDFTAKMEDDLDEVARGKIDWQPMVADFYQPFSKKLEKTKDVDRVEIPTEKTGKKCPKCKKGEVVIRVGKYGKFLSCSTFPDCDWKDSYQEVVKGVKCPDCGGKVIIKQTRKGKRFYGCSNYPKCKWASWRRPKPDKK